MIVVIDQLVFHKYDNSEICSNIIPNVIKQPELEWNKEDNKTNKYANDISKSDIVLSFRLFDRNEDFGYIFITKNVSPFGEQLYRIRKTVVDKELSIESIRYLVTQSLECYIKGDVAIASYIETKERRIFYEHTQKSVLELVAEDICQGCIGQKQDITSNSIIVDIARRINEK